MDGALNGQDWWGVCLCLEVGRSSMDWALCGWMGGWIDARHGCRRTWECSVRRCDNDIAKTGRGVVGTGNPPHYFGCWVASSSKRACRRVAMLSINCFEGLLLVVCAQRHCL